MLLDFGYQGRILIYYKSSVDLLSRKQTVTYKQQEQHGLPLLAIMRATLRCPKNGIWPLSHCATLENNHVTVLLQGVLKQSAVSLLLVWQFCCEVSSHVLLYSSQIFGTQHLFALLANLCNFSFFAHLEQERTGWFHKAQQHKSRETAHKYIAIVWAKRGNGYKQWWHSTVLQSNLHSQQ